MADLTLAATIVAPNEPRPQHVVAVGRDGGGKARPLPVGGYVSEWTVTRPNNTDAYGAGDVVGASTGASAAIELTNIGPPGGYVNIAETELWIAASSIISGETSYAMELHTAAPASEHADADTYDLEANDRAAHVGTIQLGSIVDKGATLKVGASGVNKRVKLADGSTSLWFYLVTNGAHTPTAQRVYAGRVYADPL